jgi:hypothetical protein
VTPRQNMRCNNFNKQKQTQTEQLLLIVLDPPLDTHEKNIES